MQSDVLEQPGNPQALPAAGIDATDPLPPARPDRYRQLLTAIVAFAPPVVLAMVVIRTVGHSIPWFGIVLAAIFIAVIGHGVTIGFHRLFTHRSFEACRPLKIALAVAGSMSFQGSLIGWVADHRRHHRYADRVGDPHSPSWVGPSAVRGPRGFWHAHIGWTFRGETTCREQYAPDLLADPDLVLVDRMFVPCCIATLAVPFAIGYLWTGALAGAVGALLIAGVIRIGISHNFTWSINSVCHTFGTRSFATRDTSTNVPALALFTMGESWHNNHHAFPRLARHGVDRGQLDTSAACIRLFERLGWARNVQWPDPAQLAARRMVR
jgi:stearoyl-CoA desaturase (delta-9 desaturase)